MEKEKNREERKEETTKTKKLRKLKRIGISAFPRVLLWGLLLFSFVFAIYKNFTAVDTRTVETREVVEKELVDTAGVESYVKKFASVYFSWTNTAEALAKRTEAVSEFLSQDLSFLAKESVRSDIPTSSQVTEVSIWRVQETGEKTYQVTFSVSQKITEQTNPEEPAAEKNVMSFYQVGVYDDQEQGEMRIISSPSVTEAVKKAEMTGKGIVSSEKMEALEKEEIHSFLESFFTGYPKASAAELSYYGNEGLFPVIRKPLIYSEIVSLTYQKTENGMLCHFFVKYLDEETKSALFPEYQVRLVKDGKHWKFEEVMQKELMKQEK